MLRREDLIGTWREVSADFVRPDGTTFPAWTGLDARLMYSTDGYVSVVSAPLGRPAVPGTARFDLNEVPAEDLPPLVKDVVFYTGRYEIKDDTVVHHVDISVLSNWHGVGMLRFVELDGDQLSLISEPEPDGTYRRVRWTRMPAL